MVKTSNSRSPLSPVTNDGADLIEMTQPYRVAVTIEGVIPILFHRWSVEAVAEKAAAAKGSKGKKSDNLESYVYRNEEGEICIPGEYLRASICSPTGAAKYRQDPRSPRKSALDLYKAGIFVATELASLGVKDWDYLDQRRVTIQRSGITRVRPAMAAGWTAEFEIGVVLPEYIPPSDLRAVLIDAGRLVGLGDFRPTYGRFDTTKFQLIQD